MFVKNLTDCSEFIANDGCHLRELLHPKNDSIDLPYSIAIARIEVNKSTYKHKLKQAEVYFIQSGAGKMHIDEEAQKVKQGDVIFIPPGSVQWLENTGNSEICFIAIVSPPWSQSDDSRI